MTKTDARLALAQRQRRFEWELAREEQTRAAARFVAGRTHDLLNMVQIAKLASLQLETMCSAQGKEFIDDLLKAAEDAEVQLGELMAVARPDVVIERGAPVGAAIDAALTRLRDAIEVDIHLATSPDTRTRLSAHELEHLLIGLALDVIDGEAGRIELFVRERAIDGKPWIEVVRATSKLPANDTFELRAVTAIANKAGGELATSDRRGGGSELIVSLPIVD
jgi:hypothetical protein